MKFCGIVCQLKTLDTLFMKLTFQFSVKKQGNQVLLIYTKISVLETFQYHNSVSSVQTCINSKDILGHDDEQKIINADD